LEPVELIHITEDDELPEWVKQDFELCVEEEELYVVYVLHRTTELFINVSA
jgi:hypothetical protein